MKLLLSALAKLIVGLGLIVALLFGPAGTFDYAGGWRLLGVLFVPMLLLGVALFIWAPDLLRSRLKSKEQRGTQKGVVALSGVLFVAAFVVAGLDYRFGWSKLPEWSIWLGSILFLVGYGLYGEVMRENRWLSRSVEVVEGQKVVSTGLYGIVRHPMYSVTIVMFLSMPIVLGSLWAFVVMLPYVVIVALRALDEERLLTSELDGYKEYCTKVRWRLLPFVW